MFHFCLGRYARTLLIVSCLLIGLLTACSTPATPTEAPPASNTPLPTTLPQPSSTPTPEPLPPTPIPATDYLQEGRAALLAGDMQVAEQALEQALAGDPEVVAAQAWQAYLLSQQPGNWQQALELAAAAAEQDPEDATAQAMLALVQLELGHYQDIVSTAKKAVELDPDSALAHAVLALVRLEQHDTGAAGSEIEQALALAPDDPFALRAAVDRHLALGELDQALNSAETLVAAWPDSAEGYLALAWTQLRLQAYQESRAALERSLEIWPGRSQALIMLSILEERDGNQEEAFKALDRADVLAPDDPAVMAARAWLHYSSGQKEQVLQWVSKVLAVDPEYQEAHQLQGFARLSLGNCEDGRRSFSQALALWPDAAESHLGLALCLECLGETARAEEGFERAIALAPNNANLVFTIARHQLEQGNAEQAVESLQNVLGLVNDRPSFYIALADAHMMLEDDEAQIVGNLEQALALEPDNVAALQYLGAYYNNSGEYELAIDLFEQLLTLDLDPSYDADREMCLAHHGLGQAYTGLADYEAAIDHLLQVTSWADPAADNYQYLARAYRETGRLEEAGQALISFLDYAPPMVNADVSYALAAAMTDGSFYLTQEEVSVQVQDTMVLVAEYLSEYVSYQIVSVELVTQDEQPRIDILIDVGEDPGDDDVLLFEMSTAVGGSAFLLTRADPPISGGIQITLQDADGAVLADAKFSSQTALDMLEGFVSDVFQLVDLVQYRDLRRPEVQLPLQDAVNEIIEKVETDRDLAAEQEVTFDFMTADELRTHLEQAYAEESEQEKQADEDLLVLLDLMESGRDLDEMMIELQSNAIAGFYDLEEKTFFVITEEDRDAMTVNEEMTFAHEYVHALQDQHHGLSAIEDDENLNDDQRLAIRSVAEGEATAVTVMYFTEHLTGLEQMVAYGQMNAEQESLPDDLPPVLITMQECLYSIGYDFIEAVAPNGYWPAIEALYQDLPLSTEQLLHPEKYEDGDERDDPQEVTLPAALDELDATWQETDHEVMGELFTRLYLAELVSPDLAQVGAAGWDGDRYRLWRHQETGNNLLVWQTVWDSAQEAREFVSVHLLALDEHQGYTLVERHLASGDRLLRWQNKERGVLLRQRGETTWLLYASDPAELDLLLPLLADEME